MGRKAKTKSKAGDSSLVEESKRKILGIWENVRETGAEKGKELYEQGKVKGQELAKEGMKETQRWVEDASKKGWEKAKEGAEVGTAKAKDYWETTGRKTVASALDEGSRKLKSMASDSAKSLPSVQDTWKKSSFNVGRRLTRWRNIGIGLAMAGILMYGVGRSLPFALKDYMRDRSTPASEKGNE